MAEHLLANRRSVIEITRYEPIDIFGTSFFERHTQARIPHLASINAPGIQDFRVPGQGLLSKIIERPVPFHRVMGLPVHDGNWPGVDVFLTVQASDQFIERFEIGISARLAERIDNHRMDTAMWFLPRFFLRLELGAPAA